LTELKMLSSLEVLEKIETLITSLKNKQIKYDKNDIFLQKCFTLTEKA